MNFLNTIHETAVYNRRIERLADLLNPLFPKDATCLDIGCGDGQLAHKISQYRNDINYTGIDVLIRPQIRIPVKAFDGLHIPYESDSFDVVTFTDVLHHTRDPLILLKEAKRVARNCIIIKDHCADGFLATRTLRFMDYVGNERHGVHLPYNYFKKSQWLEAFDNLELKITSWLPKLGIYPFPFSLAFDRKLHFISVLET